MISGAGEETGDEGMISEQERAGAEMRRARIWGKAWE